MWQLSVNILFGIIIALTVFVFRSTLNPLLGWMLMSSSFIIIASAVWGWIEIMSQYSYPKESPLSETLPSTF